MLRWLFRILAVLVVLALAGGGFLYWKLRPRVEKIPAELASFDEQLVDGLRLPGVKGQPPLVLREQRGKTVFLLVEGKESMEARESRELVRALNTWDFPADVQGFLIGEAEGLGFLAWKIDEYVTALQRESRFPLYMDYQGQVLRGFNLPKGHTGMVVIGKDGQVVYRHSGKSDEEDLKLLKATLGLRPPPPPPPGRALRDFEVADLDGSSCAHERRCVFVFLSRPIRAGDLPGKDNKAAWSDPDARLVAAFADRALPEASSGIFLGGLDGIAHAQGWRVAGDSLPLRQKLGIEPGTTAVIVVDGYEVMFDERGFIPAWRYSEIELLLGMPPA